MRWEKRQNQLIMGQVILLLPTINPLKSTALLQKMRAQIPLSVSDKPFLTRSQWNAPSSKRIYPTQTVETLNGQIQRLVWRVAAVQPLENGQQKNHDPSTRN